MKKIWKIVCQEDKHPGMWHRWFRNQCVSVGWAGMWGYKLEGKTKDRGWSTARNAIKEMERGDLVIVALTGNKIGRLGEITEKLIGDDQWDPLVPPSPTETDGLMGRRILVRWELTTGPEDLDLVVKMPLECTFSRGELRPTISRIYSRSISQIREVMNDSKNWVSLLGKFHYESALSDYIATYPHHLEEGLFPHPEAKIRERVFKDKSRLDVLLIDSRNKPVIVECKQHSPSAEDIKQLRHYMGRLKKEAKRKARGILVHGGSRKLSSDVAREARRKPRVEVVRYRLEVDFEQSSR